MKKATQQNQEQNVEFLEKSLTNITGRKYAVACSNGTDALHFALISFYMLLVGVFLEISGLGKNKSSSNIDSSI